MDVLPVDVVHWFVALSSIVVLLWLLAVRGWKAPAAGPVGMVVGAAAAMLVFRTPLETLAISIGAGLWDAFFVLLVVWSALLLYRVTDAAGALAALRDGIQEFSTNQLFLVLAFGWVFCSFLQGVAGFGVPVAVVAPLLVALGVRPVTAVAIALIGHAWACMFGTLGVAWIATEQVIAIDDPATTALRAALLLWIPNLFGGLAIAWLFGRWDGVRHGWPMIAVISFIHGGGQLAVTSFDPTLSAFLASAVAMVALYPLSRWGRYATPTEDIDERPAMEDDTSHLTDHPEPPMTFAWSLLPYAALTASAALVLAVPPVRSALESLEVGPHFGATSTGYGVERDAADTYAPLTPLTHPALFLLFAAAVTWAVYRRRGWFDEWGRAAEPEPVWSSTVRDAAPASAAIVTFLVLAQVLDLSGQTEVLALGISAVVPATVYAFFANSVGVLGAFMTSSNTSSNVLFADLQRSVAQSESLPQATIIAAQSAGGAVGNAIGPANVVLGTTTAGSSDDEGEVLRHTLPWAAAMTVLVGAATVALL